MSTRARSSISVTRIDLARCEAVVRHQVTEEVEVVTNPSDDVTVEGCAGTACRGCGVKECEG